MYTKSAIELHKMKKLTQRLIKIPQQIIQLFLAELTERILGLQAIAIAVTIAMIAIASHYLPDGPCAALVTLSATGIGLAFAMLRIELKDIAFRAEKAAARVKIDRLDQAYQAGWAAALRHSQSAEEADLEAKRKRRKQKLKNVALRSDNPHEAAAARAILAQLEERP